MSSNYPPGVTGSEPQIVGGDDPDMRFSEVSAIVADLDDGPGGWYVDTIERTAAGGWWVMLWQAETHDTRDLCTWMDWRAFARSIGR